MNTDQLKFPSKARSYYKLIKYDIFYIYKDFKKENMSTFCSLIGGIFGHMIKVIRKPFDNTVAGKVGLLFSIARPVIGIGLQYTRSKFERLRSNAFLWDILH